jgi:type I restriction enzyme M protein
VSTLPVNRKIKLNAYDDERFKPYAPKKSTELAYLLDMLYNLDEDGTIKILVRTAVLRSLPDKKIIKYLVDNELISIIIGLPQGEFEIAEIQRALLVINKKPTENGIYYLNLKDAETKRELKKKVLSIVDIDKYVSLLSNREEQKLISKIATIDDIRENDYNLSINRYVDLEILEAIDIEKTIANIKAIKKELKQVDEELNEKIGELLKK